MDYRAEVDGLRAVAVLSVVFFHAFPDSLSGGFVGVDIFFVISGYLITRIIFEELDTGSFSLASFYQRRIRRIFPALILVLVSALGFGWVALLSGEFAQLAKHVTGASAFVLNFLLVNEAGYFDSAAETKPMLHLWSLAVEEQFYIVWPVILCAAHRYGRSLLGVILIIGLISFSTNLYLSSALPVRGFYWPYGRFWELLSGSLLAWITLYAGGALSRFTGSCGDAPSPANKAKPKWPRVLTAHNAAALTGLALLAWSITHFNEATRFPGYWALMPVIGTLLVIAAGKDSSIARLMLSNRVIVWIGLISYPLYLWHWPVLSFMRIVRGEAVVGPAAFVAVTVSVLLAGATYHLWEIPLRRLNDRGMKVVLLSASMIVIGAVSLFVYAVDGRIGDGNAKQLVADTVVVSPKRRECHFSRDKAALERPACVYFAGDATVAVVGNSHATELAFAVAQELELQGLGAVVHHTMSSCRHSLEAPSNRKDKICADWHEAVSKALIDDQNIRDVVLSYRNEKYLADRNYRDALVLFANRFAEAGKNVVLVLQAPLPKKHIYDSIRRDYWPMSTSVNGRSLAEWRLLYGASEALGSELRGSVTVLDPADYFCADGGCKVIDDGVALFFDDHHMSLGGARLLAPVIVEEFERSNEKNNAAGRAHKSRQAGCSCSV